MEFSRRALVIIPSVCGAVLIALVLWALTRPRTLGQEREQKAAGTTPADCEGKPSEPLHVPRLTGQEKNHLPMGKRGILLDSSKGETARNNAANELRRQGDVHLVDDLTRMLWAEQETPKWRNYCVQQLTQRYLEKPSREILDTVLGATESPVPEIQSCAVWSLALIAADARSDAKVVERGKQIALGALKDEGAHLLVRTGGVQASARLGLREALPGIRRLASSEQTKPTSLRVAAVAALGDLKDAESTSVLETLAKEASGQLQAAARIALAKIRKSGSADRMGGNE